MYRCTECQEEYKEKPNYCSCGNDEFEEIIEPSAKSEQPVKAEKTANSTNIQWQFWINTIFPVSFLVSCIILSIAIWLIKIPSLEKSVEEQLKTSSAVNLPPDVENFWKDTDKASVTEQKKEQTPAAEQKSQSAASTSQKQNSSVKTTSKPANTTAASTKPAAKNTSKTTTANPAVSTNAQTPKQTTSTANNTTPKTSSQNQQTSQKPKLPDSVLNVGKTSPQTQSTPTTQTAQTAPKPFNYKPAPKMDEGEFLKYKGEIRSALLAKLNVAAIQGSGECAVEFSLDSTGKLINRIFVYKSSNKSVNDEVYLMLMRLPNYKKPPKYYNNEKIRLKFYFNNGYYEITFI